MIIRYYISCNICGSNHLLRVQMGYSPLQKHTISCSNCKEPIHIEFKDIYTDSTPILTNATLSTDKNYEHCHYLTPDFIADGNQASNEFYFGSIDLMRKLIDDGTFNTDDFPPDDGQNYWNSLTDAPTTWGVLLSSWRLEKSRKSYLSQKRLREVFDGQFSNPWEATSYLSAKMFGFCEELHDFVNQTIKSHPIEFNRLTLDYEYNKKLDLCNNEFDIFSKFFEKWTDFSQVYIYVAQDLDIPEHLLATSSAFFNVTGFYGAAQEFFSKQLVLLTAINNINAGRTFDMLGRISLKSYASSDNAKRRENFKDNLILTTVSTEYDSALRNAEAHRWCEIESGGGAIIYKKDGSDKKN